MFKRTKISTERMIQLERKLEKISYIRDIQEKSESDVAKELKLKVLFVPAISLSSDVEAVLEPIDTANADLYNGLIRIKDEYKNSRFAYVHELLHYIMDIGAGKKVDRSFARNIKGKTKDVEKQEMNYMTAATLLPKEAIEKRIREYDQKHPKMDEIALVRSICQDYSQSWDSVIRRIQEIRKINKFSEKSHQSVHI